MNMDKRLTDLFLKFSFGSNYVLHKYGDGTPTGIDVTYLGTLEELLKLQKFLLEWIGINPYVRQHKSIHSSHRLDINIRDNRMAVERLVTCLENYSILIDPLRPQFKDLPEVVVEGITCIRLDLSHITAYKFGTIALEFVSLVNVNIDSPFFTQKIIKKEFDPTLAQTIKQWGATEEQFGNIRAVLEKDPKFIRETEIGQQICLPKMFVKCYADRISEILAS